MRCGIKNGSTFVTPPCEALLSGGWKTRFLVDGPFGNIHKAKVSRLL